jgi:3-methyladenine DNA glycosylase AlkD
MPRSKKAVDALVADTVVKIRSLHLANVPAIREVRRQLSAKLRNDSAKDVLVVATALIKNDLRWVGYEILHKHRGALASLKIREVEALGKGIDSWVSVDTFGCYIAGPALLSDQISIAQVAKWAKAKDLWWRRAALVATTVLNKKSAGGKGDVERTLKIVSMLIDDREDMVVKAMSWALRSLSAVKPKETQRFLMDHKDRLAPRVIRETKHKLEFGVKSKRRDMPRIH